MFKEANSGTETLQDMICVVQKQGTHSVSMDCPTKELLLAGQFLYTKISYLN